jgi:DNA-binding transcriptional LysR family regulator
MQALESNPKRQLVLDVSGRQLDAFAAVAATLSYARAAEQLQYTEPGVYAQIKRLERALGCELFRRRGRGLELTRGGIQLLPYCRSILADLERMNQVRSHLARLQYLTIAAGPATGSYLLPELIRTFGDMETGIAVDLTICPIEQVAESVASGGADLGISGALDQFPLPNDLKLVRWLETQTCLLAGGGLPLALQPPIVVYLATRDPRLPRSLQRWFSDLAIADYEVRSLPSADAVKGACLAGLGYALLPRHAALMELASGVLCEVPGLSVFAPLWICHPSEAHLTSAGRSFIEYLQDLPELPASLANHDAHPSEYLPLEPPIRNGDRPKGPESGRRPYAQGGKRQAPERTENLRAALEQLLQETPYLTRAAFANACRTHMSPCNQPCGVEYVARIWGNWDGNGATLWRCLPSRNTIYNNWPLHRPFDPDESN